jgi:hypothetical protein
MALMRTLYQTQKRRTTMPGITFQKIVGDCELLSSNLKPLLAEMPLLQEESDALDALVTRAKSLANEQEVLTGRLREITRLRQETQRESNDMRSRVAALLRGKLGFNNEILLGFGVPPRKRSRKKPEAKVTPPPAPAEPSRPAGNPEPAE